MNSALDADNSDDVMRALQDPAAELPEVDARAATLYHEELKNMKSEKQAPLEHEELESGLKGVTSHFECHYAI